MENLSNFLLHKFSRELYTYYHCYMCCIDSNIQNIQICIHVNIKSKGKFIPSDFLSAQAGNENTLILYLSVFFF